AKQNTLRVQMQDGFTEVNKTLVAHTEHLAKHDGEIKGLRTDLNEKMEDAELEQKALEVRLKGAIADVSEAGIIASQKIRDELAVVVSNVSGLRGDLNDLDARELSNNTSMVELLEEQQQAFSDFKETVTEDLDAARKERVVMSGTMISLQQQLDRAATAEEQSGLLDKIRALEAGMRTNKNDISTLSDQQQELASSVQSQFAKVKATMSEQANKLEIAANALKLQGTELIKQKEALEQEKGRIDAQISVSGSADAAMIAEAKRLGDLITKNQSDLEGVTASHGEKLKSLEVHSVRQDEQLVEFKEKYLEEYVAAQARQEESVARIMILENQMASTSSVQEQELLQKRIAELEQSRGRDASRLQQFETRYGNAMDELAKSVTVAPENISAEMAKTEKEASLLSEQRVKVEQEIQEIERKHSNLAGGDAATIERELSEARQREQDIINQERSVKLMARKLELDKQKNASRDDDIARARAKEAHKAKGQVHASPAILTMYESGSRKSGIDKKRELLIQTQSLLLDLYKVKAKNQLENKDDDIVVKILDKQVNNMMSVLTKELESNRQIRHSATRKRH
ncbi:MAG: hypothetical protein HON32_05145, partial [Francisellaceae bacterium]|nr:hypothetical protein [Francisellaceae bacterium]